MTRPTAMHHDDPLPEHGSAPLGGDGDRFRRLTRNALVTLAASITATAVIAALTGRADPDDGTSTGVEGLLLTQVTTAWNSPSKAEPRFQLPDDGSPATATDSATGTPPIEVPETGAGVFDVAGAGAGDVPRPHGAVTYTVEVERGLPFNAATVAEFVDATLRDPRGWATRRPLVQVATEPDFRIRFATPATADGLCAPLDTGGRLSCRNGENVVINAWRWVNGATGYSNLTAYRRYVINHEVGHALGHAHTGCPAPRALAPVMLQQTLGLQGCQPNPWPQPERGRVGGTR